MDSIKNKKCFSIGMNTLMDYIFLFIYNHQLDANQINYFSRCEFTL